MPIRERRSRPLGLLRQMEQIIRTGKSRAVGNDFQRQYAGIPDRKKRLSAE
jgi:hypothetical protein